MSSCAQALCFPAQRALSILVLLAIALPAYGGQGDYVLGTSVNLTAGASNRPQSSASQAAGNSLATYFYGAYPSLSLTSTRQRSSLSANYAFGFNRTINDSIQQPPGSHTASLNLSTALGPRWSARLADSFSMADALGIVNSLNGATPAAAGSALFSFSAVAPQTTIRRNGANASLSWALDPSSSISFTAAHTIQKYSSGTPSNGLFPDQQQLSGGVSFRQQLGIKDSWALSYKGTHSEYGSFRTSTAQSVKADYSVEIARNTTLKFGAGLTQVNSAGSGRLRYDASASLAKTVLSNTFSLDYDQNSAELIGLGSTSTTQRATVVWNRAFGKATMATSASGYESTGTLNNRLNTKGVAAVGDVAVPITGKLTLSVTGTLDNSRGSGTPSFTQKRAFATTNLAFAVTRTLSVSGGVMFQNTKQNGTFNFTQRRAFVSLRYTEPNLKRFN